MASLKHIHRFPVAAKVLGQTIAELEADPQPTVLEEDVSVPQLRKVKAYSLSLLGEGSLHAPDESGLFKGVYASVTRSNRYSILSAQLYRRPWPLERRY